MKRFRAVLKVLIVAGLMLSSSSVGIATFLPNDPSWDDPLHDDCSWARRHVYADDAWDVTGEGELTNPGMNTIVVAVIDSGIQLDHPDLANRIWVNQDEIPGNGIDDDVPPNGYIDDVYGWNVAGSEANPGIGDNDVSCGPHHHGLYVSGVIAAVIDNDRHIAGMAQVQIMMVKQSYWDTKGTPETEDDEYVETDEAGKVEAVEYAIDNGADVISISWGDRDQAQAMDYLDDTLTEAYNKDIVVVAGSGNWIEEEHDDEPENGRRDDAEIDSVIYPARHHRVIAVGATTWQNRKADYSFYGPALDMMAPGGQWPTPGANADQRLVWTLEFHDPGDGPTKMDGVTGTSIACPHVSGAAALMLSYRPDLGTEEVKMILQATAEDIILGGTGGENPLSGKDQFTGYGQLNTYEALQVALGYQSEWTAPLEFGNAMGGLQYQPAVNVDSEGNLQYVWIDDRTGRNQVYYRKVSPSGVDMFPESMVSDDTKECSWASFDNPPGGEEVYISWIEKLSGINNYQLKVFGMETEPLVTTPAAAQIFNIVVATGHLMNTVTLSRKVVHPNHIYVVYGEKGVDWDIKVAVVSNTGQHQNPGAPWVVANSNTDDEGYYFHADIAQAGVTDYIFIVWENLDRTTSQRDVMWQRVDMTGGKLLNPPLRIWSAEWHEARPDIRVEVGSGISHIVYEDHGATFGWQNQILKYVAVDKDGNFLILPYQVGSFTDHSATEGGPNGKYYPRIDFEAFESNHIDAPADYHTIVHVVWREWEDDYEVQNQQDDDGDGIQDEWGYSSIYHAAFVVKDAIFTPDKTICDITPGFEEVIYRNIDDVIGSGTHVDISVSNTRRTLGWQYDRDSNVHLVFHENQLVGAPAPSYRIMAGGTEPWWSTCIVMNSNGEWWDPDMVFWEDGIEHNVVVTGKDWYLQNQWEVNPPALPVNPEIYCYNSLFNLWHRISNKPTAANPNDPPSTTSSVVMYKNYDGFERSFITWVEEIPGAPDELWGAIIDPTQPVVVDPDPARTWMTNYLWGPALIPSFVIQAGKDPTSPTMCVDGREWIHISYAAMGRIWHIGLDNLIPPQPQYHDNQVQGLTLIQCDNPAIDVDITDRVHIAYESSNNIYYDRLVEGVLGAPPVPVLLRNAPMKVDDQNGAEDSLDPDLKIDQQIKRRSDLAWVEPAMNDRSVHITWTRSDPGHQEWSIVYTKYSMTGELPLIPEKDILTEDQYFEGSWVDPMGPEMSMDPENGIYISFSGRTLGPKPNYASMFCKRLFYVHLDNNGEVKTTISRISRQDLRAAWPGGNPMDIDHYGGDVDVNGWYYTVHDLYVTNQAQYHGDIEMRYFKGMSDTYTHT
jgi:subtilisin family serine protease